MASVAGRGVVRVSRLGDQHAHLLLGHQGTVREVALSADGRWVATSSLEDGTVRLWPMPDLDCQPLHTLPRAELLARLSPLTNLRSLPDDADASGWAMTKDPFPGWETLPPQPEQVTGR